MKNISRELIQAFMMHYDVLLKCKYDHYYWQIFALLEVWNLRGSLSHFTYYAFSVASNKLISKLHLCCSWHLLQSNKCKDVTQAYIKIDLIKNQVQFGKFFENLGSVGRAETVFTVSWWCSSNKAVALLALSCFHFECLSCSLKVVSVECRSNKQHDGCIRPLSESYRKLTSLDIEPKQPDWT